MFDWNETIYHNNETIYHNNETASVISPWGLPLSDHANDLVTARQCQTSTLFHTQIIVVRNTDLQFP